MNFCTLLLAAAIQQDEGKEYWNFKTGTQWLYVEKAGKNTTTSKMTVKEVKDGKVFLDNEETKEGENEPFKTEKLCMFFDDGCVKWSKIEEDQEKVMFHIFKPASKKGDKWKSPFADSGTEVEIENVGTEDITVFEKEYKGAIHCRFEIDRGEENPKMTADFYFSKGIGLVKMEMKSGKETFSIELKEFKAGK